MQVRQRRNSRNRSAGDPSTPFRGADAVATCSIVATKARLTFTQPVQAIDLPLSITCQGLPPTAFTQVSPVIIDLDYAADVVATNVLVIPGNVPEIRTASGGYVAAQTHTF